MIRRTLQWLDHRTGWVSSFRRFRDEEIPASAGWPQAFGSVVLFLFLLQALTGLLLSLNYAPTPLQAYSSLQFIMMELSGGRILRGLHHWGASAVIVVLVLHMVQVFLAGAYKPPREVTWMLGVFLFLVTFAFALTGYLLPWDNRAYWGTVVTTQIGVHVPWVGPWLLRWLGAEEGIGVVTFARFYAAHTLLLPAASALLIALHVGLVRRHGVAPGVGHGGAGRRFFPAQAVKDAAAMFISFAFVFLLAVLVDAPLEGPADPFDANYVPRPEWYFLFLFQALRLVHGSIEPAVTVVLPAAAVGALFAVPFVDRSRVKRVAERTVALVIVGLSFLAWASLTLAGAFSNPYVVGGMAPSRTLNGWVALTPWDLAGVGHFHQFQCSRCHNLLDGEPKAGPPLTGLTPRLTRTQLLDHFRRSAPEGLVLTSEQVETVDFFLRRLTPEHARALVSAPPDQVAGAQIFVNNACGKCHAVNGSGGSLGPSLNGVADRHPREWIAEHLKNPKSHSPDTVMPAFSFSPDDEALLIEYLATLPVQ